MLKYIWIYVVAINIYAFCICAWDKHCAIKGKWRVSEHALLLSAMLGGSVGLWLSMQSFRHKTKHKQFTLLVPAIFIVQVIILCLLYFL